MFEINPDFNFKDAGKIEMVMRLNLLGTKVVAKSFLFISSWHYLALDKTRVSLRWVSNQLVIMMLDITERPKYHHSKDTKTELKQTISERQLTTHRLLLPVSGICRLPFDFSLRLLYEYAES